MATAARAWAAALPPCAHRALLAACRPAGAVGVRARPAAAGVPAPPRRRAPAPLCAAEADAAEPVPFAVSGESYDDEGLAAAITGAGAGASSSQLSDSDDGDDSCALVEDEATGDLTIVCTDADGAPTTVSVTQLALSADAIISPSLLTEFEQKLGDDLLSVGVTLCLVAGIILVEFGVQARAPRAAAAAQRPRCAGFCASAPPRASRPPACPRADAPHASPPHHPFTGLVGQMAR
jgi:hypothetical protein